ncbi:MAG: D-alanine--D-alanine ligase [Planctomycetes bacterium]|nr:D-alanine--D-alanine ligase [Planctomycetota bacterium]
MDVGLVFDLRSEYVRQGLAPEQVAEFDTDETISAIEGAIRSLGHGVERVGGGRALAARLAAGARWDLVFNFAEGLCGRSREAQVPCLLELYGVPYTFSDPLACAATLDKAAAKRLVRDAGLPTPPFAVVRDEGDLAGVDLEYPLFAKPLAEGTGKGIDRRSRVDTPAALAAVCRDLLARFAQPVLVEEYLPGREFTVAVLGTGREARVLGAMEIEVRREAGSDIYSYQAKERCEELVRYVSRPPSPALESSDGPAAALWREAEALALAAYRVLECRDAGRVDVRCDRAGRPALLEVNALPGLHPTHSDLPMIAAREGMSYRDLIGAIIGCACRRLGIGHEAE